MGLNGGVSSARVRIVRARRAQTGGGAGARGKRRKKDVSNDLWDMDQYPRCIDTLSVKPPSDEVSLVSFHDAMKYRNTASTPKPIRFGKDATNQYTVTVDDEGGSDHDQGDEDYDGDGSEGEGEEGKIDIPKFENSD